MRSCSFDESAQGVQESSCAIPIDTFGTTNAVHEYAYALKQLDRKRMSQGQTHEMLCGQLYGRQMERQPITSYFLRVDATSGNAQKLIPCRYFSASINIRKCIVLSAPSVA